MKDSITVTDFIDMMSRMRDSAAFDEVLASIDGGVMTKDRMEVLWTSMKIRVAEVQKNNEDGTSYSVAADVLKSFAVKGEKVTIGDVIYLFDMAAERHNGSRRGGRAIDDLMEIMSEMSEVSRGKKAKKQENDRV